MCLRIFDRRHLDLDCEIVCDQLPVDSDYSDYPDYHPATYEPSAARQHSQ